MTETAIGKDPKGRNRTCDALGHKLDATGVDSEAAQAKKSSAKKKKKEKAQKGLRPRAGTRACRVRKHTRSYQRGSRIRNVAHKKAPDKKNYKKTGRKNQPPTM